MTKLVKYHEYANESPPPINHTTSDYLIHSVDCSKCYIMAGEYGSSKNDPDRMMISPYIDVQCTCK